MLPHARRPHATRGPTTWTDHVDRPRGPTTWSGAPSLGLGARALTSDTLPASSASVFPLLPLLLPFPSCPRAPPLPLSPARRFAPLLATKHARIVGREVDLSRLLSQRMNSMLRASLDLALARFEARPLDAVTDLHAALAVLRLTHAYLSEHLPFLDPIQAVLTEGTDHIAGCSLIGASVAQMVPLTAHVLLLRRWCC